MNLKPCPFCGGEAEIKSIKTMRKRSYFFIGCIEHCEVLFSGFGKARNIKKWNTRAGEKNSNLNQVIEP